MSFTIEGRIGGVKDLLDRLRRFGDAVEKKVLKPALVAAAKPVVAAARAALDAAGVNDSRSLRGAIGAVAKSYPSGTVVVLIGPRSGFAGMVVRRGKKQPRKADPRFYAHLVELGTRPHAVGKGSRLRLGKKGAGPQSGGTHPGAKKSPFLRPGWERAKGQATTILVKRIEDGITQEISR